MGIGLVSLYKSASELPVAIGHPGSAYPVNQRQRIAKSNEVSILT
jgi:hypothetical protein